MPLMVVKFMRLRLIMVVVWQYRWEISLRYILLGHQALPLKYSSREETDVFSVFLSDESMCGLCAR